MPRAAERFALFMVLISVVSGCLKEPSSQPSVNQSPKTFLWLFPDSTLAEGTSKEHVRWWGEDPDGLVRGFLFASGKFSASAGDPLPDTLRWEWTTKNDTVIAFRSKERRVGKECRS